jgi:hypothetical protein
MVNLKKIMITPFFGKLPEWFDKYEMAKGYDWLLDRDLEGFNKRIEKLGMPPITEGTGKVWDYRCALGLLYQDEVKEYNFWGHTDFDMVYGDVEKFFPDSFLENLDIHSNHSTYICGPWTMYRNIERVNNLFMECPNWKEYMSDPEANGWTEGPYSRKVETSGLRYKYTFNQGNPYTKTPNLTKENGKLYQDGTEIAMFHFRNSKKWPIHTQ